MKWVSDVTKKWLVLVGLFMFFTGCDESSLPKMPPVTPVAAASPQADEPEGSTNADVVRWSEFRRLAPQVAEIQSDLHNTLKRVDDEQSERLVRAAARRQIERLFDDAQITMHEYAVMSMRERSMTMSRVDRGL